MSVVAVTSRNLIGYWRINWFETHTFLKLWQFTSWQATKYLVGLGGSKQSGQFPEDLSLTDKVLLNPFQTCTDLAIKSQKCYDRTFCPHRGGGGAGNPLDLLLATMSKNNCHIRREHKTKNLTAFYHFHYNYNFF